MSTRPETGPMQFEGDWPGVFIRGDNAFGYAIHLREVLNNTTNPDLVIAKVVLQGLAETLESCIEKPGHDVGAQLMLKFPETTR